MFTDLVSLYDLTREDITALLDAAARLKQAQHAGQPHRLLEGQHLAMLFEKPSLRTRFTFEIGMRQLGGDAVVLEMKDARLGERESVPDVARNLERWVDGVMARTFSHEAVEELARHARIPVVNALTDKLHPCQILADALTLREHLGRLDDVKLAFVGDGNNVCASWFHLAARLPLHVTLVCPTGYEGDTTLFERARAEAEGELVITQDIDAGLDGAHAVYTDVWASMGQEAEQEERMRAFAPYQVNASLMAKARPDALFMHCLPAKRGLEVTAEVMESPRSVAFDQAENRLHAQKAVLADLMQKDDHGLCRKRRARDTAGKPELDHGTAPAPD
jgi:ornithine carbamoyltransferase